MIPAKYIINMLRISLKKHDFVINATVITETNECVSVMTIYSSIMTLGTKICSFSINKMLSDEESNIFKNWFNLALCFNSRCYWITKFVVVMTCCCDNDLLFCICCQYATCMKKWRKHVRCHMLNTVLWCLSKQTNKIILTKIEHRFSGNPHLKISSS